MRPITCHVSIDTLECKVRRFDEIALQEWRGDRIFRERFFYDPATISA